MAAAARRKPIKFTAVAPSNSEGARWLRWLDAEVFPDDTPFEFPGTNWFIGWDGSKGVAYCSWKALLQDSRFVGLHYRSGVLRSHRGRGLQKQMLTLRERDMARQGAVESVTYTSPSNAPSMRSLIASGYRPFVATDVTDLTNGKRNSFVHWRKELK